MYNIQATRTDFDPLNTYSPLPTLNIAIRGTKCQINAQDSVANIPVGGMSLPIIFDFYNCIPIDDIQIEAVFTPPYDFSVLVKPSLSIVKLKNSDA